MARYNEELEKAGALLDGAGLQPSAKGARIKFSGEVQKAKDFLEVHRQVLGPSYVGEIEIRQLSEW